MTQAPGNVRMCFPRKFRMRHFNRFITCINQQAGWIQVKPVLHELGKLFSVFGRTVLSVFYFNVVHTLASLESRYSLI